MIPPLANIVAYFLDSNFAGQLIVVVLLACSLYAWQLMVGKYMDLKRIRIANRAFVKRLEQSRTLLRIDPNLDGAKGPFADVTRSGLQAFHRAPNERHAIEHMENALSREVSRGSSRYEEKMVMLSTVVSGAPFLGLLGTVWGVMDAFGSISNADSAASISSLAPGVSGALLTTVAGLLVAIPAVFGYNYLLMQVKRAILDLETYASNLADRIELEAADLGEAGESVSTLRRASND
ncbi:MAG: MotA/TolQ/ExbB proton channel family protein [Verrucomicrobiota bacterium JB022]|nr:MotA/TolQ/ExbB proton channel family protein [Verrucomicrobiota bacterium JB022]